MIWQFLQRTGLVALVFALGLAAQPKFEVASIKPFDPRVPIQTGGLSIYPGGRVVIRAVPLRGLLVLAFGIGYWQLSGGEAWMEKEEFNLEAKPPADLQPPITNLRHGLFDISDERLREMLQALLIDRFHLKFHRESKIGKVYRLEAKGGTQTPRLTDDETNARSMSGSDAASSIGFAGAKWNMTNTSMPQLAKWAADIVLHAPVTDQTGLSGYFNHRQTTKLLESEVDYSDASGPFMIFLQEMGLKLEADKGPVEVFVIDSAEKPTPN